MNIYEMYVFHWKKPGFWVRRTTWGKTIAKITDVGPLSGRAPYYGNPVVKADVFDIHTGQRTDTDFIIDTAGTHKTWCWVQPPDWSGEEPFDPKAGRVLINVPFEKNKVASRMGARWSDILDSWWIPEDEKLIGKARDEGFFEPVPGRVFFKLPYEDRVLANRVGAKWEGHQKLWSLPETDVEAIATLEQAGYQRVPND